MLAKLHDAAFDDAGWVYEIKWDGYRAIAELKGADTRLYSRNGLSFQDAYPFIYDALTKIKKDAVLDGEVVAVDEEGNPSFQLLQQYGQRDDIALIYYVFDCLYINGQSIEDLTLLQRKELLHKLLPKNNAMIRYCDHIAERGKDFFKVMQQRGLEGMIAKAADSNYTEGARSSQWLKIKHLQTEEAIIAGYTAPRGGRNYFGALVLAQYKGKKLQYIGHTGTGFNQTTLKDVYNQLQQLITENSPFDTKVKLNAPVTWVEPKLVCNLKFTEVTSEGSRRHPVFMGLRIDKTAKEVDNADKEDNNTKDTDMDKTQTIGGKKLELTNLDKVFWPKEGFTKGDVIDYYNGVYRYIIKYLKDRPQSLYRTPNGIKGQGFFHKDAGDHAPEWMTVWDNWSESANKEINYLVCNDKPSLLYLANLGCIEINPWNSRISKPDNPDYLVLDLDPADKNTFEQVIETALVIKEILDKAKVPSYCKTSGATGLHIYVPLAAKYDYEQAKSFAHLVATMAHEQLPKFTSLERNLAKRGKANIYIDYLQNRRGQTLSSVYSLRPKPGAPVSTPLDWKEVKTGLKPTDFHIKNIMKRLEKKGDLFAPVLKKGIDMGKALKLLDQ